MTEQSDGAGKRGPFAYMREQWALAGLGGLIGAALSLAIVFGFGMLGLLPGASDAHLHDYLMSHPALAIEMQQKAQLDQYVEEQRQQQAAVDKIGLKQYLSPSVAFVTGPANAKNTFVEFFDYNCGHCRNTFPTVQKFYNAHKNDTRFAFIDFPIFGADSTAAASASVASRRQGDLFLALHFLLMSEAGSVNADIVRADAEKAGIDITKLTADVTDPAVARTPASAHKLAEDSLSSGTPMFIVNGKVHEGEISEAELKTLLKR